MIHTRPKVRAFALAGLLALALVPAACGGDDGGDGGGDADAAAVTSAPASPALPGVAETPEEEELLAAHDAMLAAINAGDADTYCSGLTADSRKRAPEYVGVSSCEEMVGLYGAAGRSKTAKKPTERKVVDITIKGDRGTIKKRAARDTNVVSSHFVKQDGKWLALVDRPNGSQPGSSQSGSQ